MLNIDRRWLMEEQPAFIYDYYFVKFTFLRASCQNSTLFQFQGDMDRSPSSAD